MKSDRYRLERISETGHQLLCVIEGREVTPESVLNDVEIQWMVTMPLYNIGEQVNCISREFAAAHPDVPWAQIAGLRHRLVHDYEGTNWSMIAAVIFDELGLFIEQIDSLLSAQ